MYIIRMKMHSISKENISSFCAQGRKCEKGCPKVIVMHDQPPPPKKPEEEILTLKTTKQIINASNMKHTLEVEFKLPRNYIPLPEPDESDEHAVSSVYKQIEG